ncbi:flavo protein [Didymella exigua CBS 183.55]|uniref:Flavo protein n=1 Tax=Didymella exigua CBS 183.55 TaxID=1150837 RepID=A0A6A5R9J9_9PLEO|nr:flavo protein [Didymella exigua CBS 183.55]KAF1924422.1 flavo protein [Didymella exigua CBS 183.55]
MHILGLANGSINGNSTILLKAALQAASLSSPETTTSWIHIPSVSYPANAGPLSHAQDVSMGANAGNNAHGTSSTKVETVDDRKALYESIMDADAILFATAVYSHQPAGSLKAVLDKVLGPYTDPAFASRILAGQRAGDAKFAAMSVDTRILKPRVCGFMAVGGSTTPDQFTMALPTLHLFAYSLHARVIDQAVVMSCANPGAVVDAEDGAVMTRAAELGRRVASQLGKAFDEAVYLGPEVEGGCPHCHLAKYDFFGGAEGRMGCVVCGNTGRFIVRNGKVGVEWDEDSDYCCITWRGKEKHIDDIFKNGSKEWKGLQGKKEELEKWRALDVGRVTLPSEEQAGVVSAVAQMQL